jgi:hypothetical protein
MELVRIYSCNLFLQFSLELQKTVTTVVALHIERLETL